MELYRKFGRKRKSDIKMKVYNFEVGGELFVTHEDHVFDTWKKKCCKLYNLTTEDFIFNDVFKNFITNEKYQLDEAMENASFIKNKMLTFHIWK